GRAVRRHDRLGFDRVRAVSRSRFGPPRRGPGRGRRGDRLQRAGHARLARGTGPPLHLGRVGGGVNSKQPFGPRTPLPFALALILVAALTMVVSSHPGPLPGDIVAADLFESLRSDWLTERVE